MTRPLPPNHGCEVVDASKWELEPEPKPRRIDWGRIAGWVYVLALFAYFVLSLMGYVDGPVSPHCDPDYGCGL